MLQLLWLFCKLRDEFGVEHAIEQLKAWGYSLEEVYAVLELEGYAPTVHLRFSTTYLRFQPEDKKQLLLDQNRWLENVTSSPKLQWERLGMWAKVLEMWRGKTSPVADARHEVSWGSKGKPWGSVVKPSTS